MLLYRRRLKAFLSFDDKTIRRLLMPVRQLLITNERAALWFGVALEANKIGLYFGIGWSVYLIWKARRLGWIPPSIFIESRHSDWYGVGVAAISLLLALMPFVLMYVFVMRRQKPNLLAIIPLLWPGAAVLLSASLIYRIKQGFLLGSRDTFSYLIFLVLIVATQAGAFVSIFLSLSITLWANRKGTRAFPEGLVMRGFVQLLILVSKEELFLRDIQSKLRAMQALERVAAGFESLNYKLSSFDAITQKSNASRFNEMAAAAREKKSWVLFSKSDTAGHFSSYVKSSLYSFASGEWDSIERRTNIESTARKKLGNFAHSVAVAAVSVGIPIAAMLLIKFLFKFDSLPTYLLIWVVAWAMLLFIAGIEPERLASVRELISVMKFPGKAKE